MYQQTPVTLTCFSSNHNTEVAILVFEKSRPRCVINILENPICSIRRIWKV